MGIAQGGVEEVNLILPQLSQEVDRKGWIQHNILHLSSALLDVQLVLNNSLLELVCLSQETFKGFSIEAQEFFDYPLALLLLKGFQSVHELPRLLSLQRVLFPRVYFAQNFDVPLLQVAEPIFLSEGLPCPPQVVDEFAFNFEDVVQEFLLPFSVFLQLRSHTLQRKA